MNALAPSRPVNLRAPRLYEATDDDLLIEMANRNLWPPWPTHDEITVSDDRGHSLTLYPYERLLRRADALHLLTLVQAETIRPFFGAYPAPLTLDSLAKLVLPGVPKRSAHDTIRWRLYYTNIAVPDLTTVWKAATFNSALWYLQCTPVADYDPATRSTLRYNYSYTEVQTPRGSAVRLVIRDGRQNTTTGIYEKGASHGNHICAVETIWWL